MSLNDLSLRLGDMRRREEALAASQEPPGLPGAGAARPDAFRPDLASSLNKLADLGRREEALAASAEATGIYRELAARWPDVYHHELEQSLHVAAWFENSEDLSDASSQESKA